MGQTATWTRWGLRGLTDNPRIFRKNPDKAASLLNEVVLMAVRRTALDAYLYQDIPFERPAAWESR